MHELFQPPIVVYKYHLDTRILQYWDVYRNL